MGKIEAILLEHRLGLQDLAKLTYFLTDIQDLACLSGGHGRGFARITANSLLVEVKALIDPRFRVEIEAIAEFKDMLPLRSQLGRGPRFTARIWDAPRGNKPIGPGISG